MTWLLITFLISSPISIGVVLYMLSKYQKALDRKRVTYIVTFPNDLNEERVSAWLRSISGTLHSGKARILATQTIVFEMWATDRGIVHRIHVPWQEADYIVAQLRSLIPGISVSPDKERPVIRWTKAIELGMTASTRMLNVPNSKDTSTSLLASVQALNPGEMVMLQWVLTPALPQSMPEKGQARSDSFSIMRQLAGVSSASSDEVDDRRKKLQQPSLLAIGRVAALSDTQPRARHLIDRLEKSLASLNTAGTSIRRELSLVGSPEERSHLASAPYLFPAQFSLPELVGVMAWPIGSPFIAGLPQGAARHLYASEDIARAGRLIGHSNFPGNERPIALAYNRASEHFYVGGSIGGGKSTLMANSFAQDVAAGYGGIVIDASNSESGEALFYRALNYVPKNRLDDVIVIDVQNDRLNPVAFNVLDQGSARVVVDQITELIGHLYRDTSGIWMRELLFHGLYTLAEHGGYTLLDLPKLIQPKTPEESQWADKLIRDVKDRELIDFWVRWDNYSTRDRATHVEPLLNRIWQLTARSEIRNIIGQTKSSFQWADALRENKIVLVSLVGLPKDTASIMGTLLVNALWTAAQSITPDKPNFLYLDEFQLMTRLPMGLEDMLRLARKHKLGVVLGTQYIDDLTPDMKSAIINAVRSRVIFATSSREARMWQSEFGRRAVDESDFLNLARFEAMAQLSTDSGMSSPVTLKALPPLKETGVAKAAVAASSKKYGRPVAQVEAEMVNRRKADPTTQRQRPNIGVKGWDE